MHANVARARPGKFVLQLLMINYFTAIDNASRSTLSTLRQSGRQMFGLLAIDLSLNKS